jgi:reductive dehalogenase
VPRNSQRLETLHMRLKAVDRPTTLVTSSVERVDMRETAYARADRGEYGPAAQEGVQWKLPERYPLSAAQKDLVDHLSEIELNGVADEVAPVTRDPKALSDHVKSLAYFLKADDVGTCKVPEHAYYRTDRNHNPVDAAYENAIVVVMRKPWDAMWASTGTDWMGDPISFQAYQHLGLVVETMANYIRRLGWHASAQYGPSFVDKYSVLIPPLLLLAGLGEVSRAGIILHPYLGLGFKAAAVLTDMPLALDTPIDFGLQSFCATCRICARNCPSRAISTGDKVMYNGYETWKLDTKRCATFNFTRKHGTICNTCVRSCPWTRPQTWFHSVVRSAVTRSALARRIAIKAAGLLDLDGADPGDRWWFDIGYAGGSLHKLRRG